VKKKYLKQLPNSVVELIQEIESFSSREIQVRKNTTPVSPTDPNPNGPACRVNNLEACIYLRNENIDAQGMTHELLHIHRYWVRKVPQIIPANDPDGTHIKGTSAIENALEHLIIVPEEAKYGFEPFSRWNETHKKLWKEDRFEQMNTFAIRMTFLLWWLAVSNLVNVAHS